MLIQRIVKAYAQIGLDVQKQMAAKQLSEAVARFGTQLDALLYNSAHTPKISSALARVALTWQPFKRVAQTSQSSERAEYLFFQSEELLFASHRVTQLLQDYSNSQQGRLINISGRQRMLSQRLAMLSMLQAWGFRSLSVQDETNQAINEFAGALETLRNSPENTQEIKAEIENASLQWVWFKNALTLEKDGAYQLIIADASESILQSMDRLTKMYEQIGRTD